MQYRNLLAIGAAIITSAMYAGNLVDDSKSVGPFGVETQVSNYLKSSSLYGTYTFNNLTLGIGVPATTEMDIKASILRSPLEIESKSTLRLLSNSIIKGFPVGISNSFIIWSEILNKYLHNALNEFPWADIKTFLFS